MGKKLKQSNNEAGYALATVVVMLLLAELILVPLLMLMTIGVRSAHFHEDAMHGFYAADAGIEDGMWRVIHDDVALPEVGGTYTYPEGQALEINGSTVGVEIYGIYEAGEETYRITSTAISDSGSTIIESYVSAERLDLSGFGENAITSIGDVTIQPGSTVSGTVQYGGELDNKGDIDGEIIEGGIENWPTAEQLSAFYLPQVEGFPFSEDTIDVDGTSTVGPLYRVGSLTIKNTSNDPKTAMLGGTVYVTGDLEIGQTNKDFTLDLNGQHIYVEGAITVGGKCTIAGSGSIIGVGDIFFLPKISAGDNFVFLMSVEGTVTFQPQDSFCGAVAGNVEVQLQPGCTLVWQEPEGVDLPSGGEGELEIHTYTVE